MTDCPYCANEVDNLATHTAQFHEAMEGYELDEEEKNFGSVLNSNTTGKLNVPKRWGDNHGKYDGFAPNRDNDDLYPSVGEAVAREEADYRNGGDQCANCGHKFKDRGECPNCTSKEAYANEDDMDDLQFKELHGYDWRDKKNEDEDKKWDFKSNNDKVESFESLGFTQGEAITMANLNWSNLSTEVQDALKQQKREDDIDNFNDEIASPASPIDAGDVDYNIIGESLTSRTKYECEYCNSGFRSNESLAIHHNDIHAISMEGLDGYEGKEEINQYTRQEMKKQVDYLRDTEDTEKTKQSGFDWQQGGEGELEDSDDDASTYPDEDEAWESKKRFNEHVTDYWWWKHVKWESGMDQDFLYCKICNKDLYVDASYNGDGSQSDSNVNTVVVKHLNYHGIRENGGEAKANENKTFTCEFCGKVGTNFSEMAQETCPDNDGNGHQIPIFGDIRKSGEAHNDEGCWVCGTATPYDMKYCEYHCAHENFDDFTGKCRDCGKSLSIAMMAEANPNHSNDGKFSSGADQTDYSEKHDVFFNGQDGKIEKKSMSVRQYDKARKTHNGDSGWGVNARDLERDFNKQAGEASVTDMANNWYMTGSNTAQCKHCNYSSDSWTSMLEHFKSAHNLFKDDSSDFLSVEAVDTCSICGQNKDVSPVGNKCKDCYEKGLEADPDWNNDADFEGNINGVKSEPSQYTQGGMDHTDQNRGDMDNDALEGMASEDGGYAVHGKKDKDEQWSVLTVGSDLWYFDTREEAQRRVSGFPVGSYQINAPRNG